MMIIPTYRVKFRLNDDADNVPAVITVRVPQTDLEAVLRTISFNRYSWFQVEREEDPQGITIAAGGVTGATVHGPVRL